MKKIALLLIGSIILVSCGTDADDATENTEASAEETAASSAVSIPDLMSRTYNDEVPAGEVITVQGWFAGLLGKMDTDEKTLYIDEDKGSNNGAVEVILADGETEKLEEANSDNQIIIKGAFKESKGFGTQIVIEDCKVIEIL